MRRRRDRAPGRRRRSADEGDPSRRGVGLRWFLALFTALTVLGVVGLLVVGFPSGPTEVVPTPQTMPPGSDATATTSPVGAAEFPDGTPAPEGVSEVLVADGSTSLSFEVPAELDLDSLRPAVAPVEVVPAADGAALSVGVGCAGSADEVLAQVSVSESDDAVTVLAVALVPDGGDPCGTGAAAGSRTVEVPLLDPLGERSVSVVPPGTPVPDLDPAAS